MSSARQSSGLSSDARLKYISQIGVDVISMQRLSRVLLRSPRLFDRLCQIQEHANLCGPYDEALVWATLLWTSKEAAAKCLQTGFWRSGIDWPDLEIAVARFDAPKDQDHTLIDLSLHVLRDWDQIARTDQGLELRVKPHRMAKKILGTDQLMGRFVIKDEMGICTMHRGWLTHEIMDNVDE